jgi:hypothetical protein
MRRTWRFPAALLLVLVLVLAFTRPQYRGDAVEYATDALAMASHASADIRLADIARTRQLAPELTPPLGVLEQDMRAGKQHVYGAFVRGRGDRVYPVHFFGYPLLAALPFKLFAALGMHPFKAFQLVNYAALYILGLALRRFFGSDARAWLGLGLFLGCGGVLYLNWTSPEVLSAACLLAGLLLFLGGAPLAGGLLGGVATLQNPTIVFFFVFAPLLKLWLGRQAHAGPDANLKPRLDRADFLGLAVGAAVFALPPLFNLYQYGVPNVIATKFSDPQLISGTRLFSFFFDLNQGMVLGIPGLLAALALCGWRGGAGRWRTPALCLLFTLALALPALSVHNWNSDAAGMMRYAFWSAMPLLLALLLRLRAGTTPWPLPLGATLALALVQAASMAHAASYSYVEFSPLARLVLAHAPRWYHPEPEIFAERSGHNDGSLNLDLVYGYGEGDARKILFATGRPALVSQVCGGGTALAADTRYVDSVRGWRYLDGPVRCTAGAAQQPTYGAAQFRSHGAVDLQAGWSVVEDDGADWRGVWSSGNRSRLVLTPPQGMHPAAVVLAGGYFDGNTRTRVRIAGVDLGWQQLDRAPELALSAARPGTPLVIELEHEAPRAPGPNDTRLLAFFLRQVILRPAP